MSTIPTESSLTAAPPRAVAVSGIIFAGLYFTSLLFARLAIPADPRDAGAWLNDTTSRSWIGFAMDVTPFTGIAFVWFMAVLRNRIGVREDRFFATVFLSTGLLFVAMLFVGAAVSQGLLLTFAADGSRPAQSDAYAVGRAMAHVLINTFAVKMAAVFMFVTSTIGLRTAFLPRWFAYCGYAIALAMLLAITDFAWIALLFPMWVLLLSAYILVADFRNERRNDAESSGANQA